MSPLELDATKNDLTYRIIGAAMAVHNAIGQGFKEEVYECALEVELNKGGVAVQRQYPVPLNMRGNRSHCSIWICLWKARLWWRSKLSATN